MFSVLQRIDWDVINPGLKQLTFNIQVTDGTYSDEAEVTVTFKDANDNAPVITPLIYEASIEENRDAGQEVFTFSAADKDRDGNGVF